MEFTDNREFYIFPHSRNFQEMTKGNLRPIYVTSLPCDTSLITVNSRDRISGTNYNFTVNLYTPLNRPLKAQVTKASIPKIPNINANNNVFIIEHELYVGDIRAVFPIGYYNQNSLVTVMQNTINTALSDLSIADTFTVDFDTTNKTLSITSGGGYKWFISDASSFYKYGFNVANFKAFPSSSPAGGTGGIGETAWYSGNAGLLYSRYVAISSNTLSSHAYDPSRTSRGLNNTVATISLVNQYDAADFSVNGVYEGNLILESATEVSSIMNVAQSGSYLQTIDFALTDEFGFDLASSLTLGAPYNTSDLGCILWVTAYL